MSNFKKMLLLSQEEVERLKAKQIREYEPALTALARLQDQMDTVLTDDKLNKLHPDERLKLFQYLKHRFDDIKNERAPEIQLAGISKMPPTEPEVAAPVAVPSGEAPPVEAASFELIGINKRYSSQANRILNLLSKHPEFFSVNERMEIVVNGTPIPKSNIHDLLSDLYATSKARIDGPRPTGFEEFRDVLAALNAPHTLMPNPAYTTGPQIREFHSLRTRKTSPKKSDFKSPTKALTLYKV